MADAVGGTAGTETVPSPVRDGTESGTETVQHRYRGGAEVVQWQSGDWADCGRGLSDVLACPVSSCLSCEFCLSCECSARSCGINIDHNVPFVLLCLFKI